jgi:hypothetical protein
MVDRLKSARFRPSFESEKKTSVTLARVHGLLQNVSVVIEGGLCPQLVIRYLLHTSPPDGKASIDGIRKVPGMFYFDEPVSCLTGARNRTSNGVRSE